MQEPETVFNSSKSSLNVAALSPVNSDKCSRVHNLNGSDAFTSSAIYISVKKQFPTSDSEQVFPINYKQSLPLSRFRDNDTGCDVFYRRPESFTLYCLLFWPFSSLAFLSAFFAVSFSLLFLHHDLLTHVTLSLLYNNFGGFYKFHPRLANQNNLNLLSFNVFRNINDAYAHRLIADGI